ncbi:MAG: tetraacyldisaccharide 4'-kinase [Desulfovibrionaceae bacterium]|nr:tetraacyldisaccharide 4'-kinase [Desulfovibrionaceae bacterium]
MSDTVTDVQRSLSAVLKPCGWLYGRAMRLRGKLYKKGLARSWTPSAPTVSVGNIGWGGTGKTPVADWLLGWAGSRGLRTVLLTRGYRAKPTTLPYVVRPGALAEEAGDEPLMLARNHERAHVVVDPDRVRAGKMAEREFDPGLIVLDDGFQHMAVRRHVNLVLLRPDDLGDGWDKVLPAGSWREPKDALKRADAFMIKTSPEGFEELRSVIDKRLGLLFKPVFSFSIAPTGVRHVVSGRAAPDLEQADYLLVSGVGEPGQVAATAERYLGYGPKDHLVFRDHHAYTKKDVLRIAGAAERTGCGAVLCTPKDAVKLGPLCTEAFWQFDLRVEFGPSTLGRDITFESWWEARFEETRGRKAGHGGNG